MAIVNTNLNNTQIETIERILELNRQDLHNPRGLPIDGRTQDALTRKGILIYNNGNWLLTEYGIQSYCATILTKYTGSTHDRIHSALNAYQRLFN